MLKRKEEITHPPKTMRELVKLNVMAVLTVADRPNKGGF